jgi:hypothetical protein
MTSLLVGDVDVSSLDINQCDPAEDEPANPFDPFNPFNPFQIRGFAATHKCHPETSFVSHFSSQEKINQAEKSY